MSDYDYEIDIDSDAIGHFRELLRAGIDALGDGDEDAQMISLGREILRKLS